MALREELEASGNWLFRWRGYLPLLLLVVVLAGFRGSHYPARNHGFDGGWEIMCLLLALAGLAVRVTTVGFVPHGTSGRNTTGQKAASLNTTGMYSIARHPLYLGNYLMWLALAAFPRLWWPPVLVTLVFWLYYERIMFAEEEFLRRKFGAEFLAWAVRTPAFWPRPGLWRPPLHPFCLRTVIRREHSSLLALVSALTAFEAASGLAAGGRLTIDPLWGALFVTTAALSLTVRLLKHRTRVLRVPGR